MTIDPILETVLLVDDEVVDQMLYRRRLERSGLVGRLLSCLSAQDALALLRTQDGPAIDLMLLDVNMPGMNGFDLLDALCDPTEPPALSAIILLSTSLDPRDRERAARYDLVKGFITKPIDEEKLMGAALAMLGQTQVQHLPAP